MGVGKTSYWERWFSFSFFFSFFFPQISFPPPWCPPFPPTSTWSLDVLVDLLTSLNCTYPGYFLGGGGTDGVQVGCWSSHLELGQCSIPLPHPKSCESPIPWFYNDLICDCQILMNLESLWVATILRAFLDLFLKMVQFSFSLEWGGTDCWAICS